MRLASQLSHLNVLPKSQHIGNDRLHSLQSHPRFSVDLLDKLTSMHRNHTSGLVTFTKAEIGSQLARMNLTRLLIDIPDDRHWVVGGIIY